MLMKLTPGINYVDILEVKQNDISWMILRDLEITLMNNGD